MRIGAGIHQRDLFGRYSAGHQQAVCKAAVGYDDVRFPVGSPKQPPLDQRSASAAPLNGRGLAKPRRDLLAVGKHGRADAEYPAQQRGDETFRQRPGGQDDRRSESPDLAGALGQQVDVQSQRLRPQEPRPRQVDSLHFNAVDGLLNRQAPHPARQNRYSAEPPAQFVKYGDMTALQGQVQLGNRQARAVPRRQRR